MLISEISETTKIFQQKLETEFSEEMRTKSYDVEMYYCYIISIINITIIIIIRMCQCICGL
jgi:hypothetical protein